MMPSMRSLAIFMILAVAALVPSVASAQPKNKKPKQKYHFVLSDVTVTKDVAADPAKVAQPRVKAQVEKAFANHPQLVVTLTGAPDPKTEPDKFIAYLKKAKLAGAHRVNVEIIDAREETEPMENRPGENRLVIRVGIRMFSETIPKRMMGFTGEGSSTIKVEVGKKVRPRDREYAWDQAAELAVKDAIAVSLTKLAIPPKAPKK
jgi:hypothetical protein